MHKLTKAPSHLRIHYSLSLRHAVRQLIVRRVDICGSAAAYVTVASAALLKPYYRINFIFTIYLFICVNMLYCAGPFIFDFATVVVCLWFFGFCGTE